MTLDVILMQIVVVLINSYIAITEKKKNIYVVTFLFNFANLIMYLVNGDKTTAILYIVISGRAFVYIFKDTVIEKLKKWAIIVPIIAIILQIVVGFSSIENIWQLLPIITPCYVCYYLWFYNTTQKLRIGNIVNNSLWLIYNVVTGLYIVSISRLITVIVNIVSYIKNKK
jgi:hypothetical protein